MDTELNDTSNAVPDNVEDSENKSSDDWDMLLTKLKTWKNGLIPSR